VGEIIAPLSAASPVQVVSPEPKRLAAVLQADGATVTPGTATALAVHGLSESAIGDLAFSAGIPIHHLHTETPDLEDAFLTLTHEVAAIR
jgi:ABC-2 type transport system ATP-binding protein